MFKKLMFVSLLMTAVMPMTAQYRVKGVATDSLGAGEPFATVRIYSAKDSTKVVKALATDADGKFNQDLTVAGEYSLSVSSVGRNTIKKTFAVSEKAPTAELGQLVFATSSTMLKGVEVVAQKPLVKSEIDRLSYDVQSDEDSKTNSTLEMLRKVPLVTVDAQDEIKVKGSTNFKIYKNGRPDNAFQGNAKNIFKSIPANMIKRIEVITEPGAKYDAEGVNGILNIVMMDNTSVKGVMGSAHGHVDSRGIVSTNAYVMTQVGKFTTSVNYGCNTISSASTENSTEVEQEYVNSGNKFKSLQTSKNPGMIHYGNIDASYEMDSLNLMTCSFGGYFYKLNVNSSSDCSMVDAAGDSIYSYTNIYESPKYQYFDFNGKFDYQHLTSHKDESLIFSYLLSTTNQTRIEDNRYENVVGNFTYPYKWNNQDSRLKFYEHTFQFDWTRPFGEKHKLEMGAKYIYRLNNSQTKQTYNDVSMDTLVDFRHSTQVAAVYGEYAFNTTKWGARAGVRYEYSHLFAKYKDGVTPNISKNLGDVVPTVSLSYKINDSNNLKLNFATRINRPGIAYLSPAIVETPVTKKYGNPDLSSVRNNSVSLSYMLMKQKITINSSLSYQFSNNDITSLTFVDDEGKLNITYDNICKRNVTGLNVYAQWQATSKTSLMLNGTVSYNNLSNNDNSDLKMSRWSYFAYSQLTQSLPWKLKLMVDGGCYNGVGSNLYSYSGNDFFYSATLRRSFLSEDRLSVSLTARNPFNGSNKQYSYTVNGDVLGNTINTYHPRSFDLNITYRFGNLKASVKKTAKTIENDDLTGRK